MTDGDGPVETQQDTADILNLHQEQFPGVPTPGAQAEGRKEHPVTTPQEGLKPNTGGGGDPEGDFSVTPYEPTVRAPSWARKKPEPAVTDYTEPAPVKPVVYGQPTRTVVGSQSETYRRRVAGGPPIPGSGRGGRIRGGSSA